MGEEKTIMSVVSEEKNTRKTYESDGTFMSYVRWSDRAPAQRDLFISYLKTGSYSTYGVKNATGSSMLIIILFSSKAAHKSIPSYIRLEI